MPSGLDGLILAFSLSLVTVSKSIPRLSIFGQWDVFWLKCFLESLYSQEEIVSFL